MSTAVNAFALSDAISDFCSAIFSTELLKLAVISASDFCKAFTSTSPSNVATFVMPSKVPSVALLVAEKFTSSKGSAITTGVGSATGSTYAGSTITGATYAGCGGATYGSTYTSV